jgi:hypothetical protein
MTSHGLILLIFEATKLFPGYRNSKGGFVVCEKPGKRQFGLSSTLFGAFEIARK